VSNLASKLAIPIANIANQATRVRVVARRVSGDEPSKRVVMSAGNAIIIKPVVVSIAAGKVSRFFILS
jgi:hypothetical protein